LMHPRGTDESLSQCPSSVLLLVVVLSCGREQWNCCCFAAFLSNAAFLLASMRLSCSIVRGPPGAEVAAALCPGGETFPSSRTAVASSMRDLGPSGEDTPGPTQTAASSASTGPCGESELRTAQATGGSTHGEVLGLPLTTGAPQTATAGGSTSVGLRAAFTTDATPPSTATNSATHGEDLGLPLTTGGPAAAAGGSTSQRPVADATSPFVGGPLISELPLLSCRVLEPGSSIGGPLISDLPLLSCRVLGPGPTD
jgi:hypothetical protein